MSDKSTAGSSATYKSYAYKADERIEDIKVVNGINYYLCLASHREGINRTESDENIFNSKISKCIKSRSSVAPTSCPGRLSL